MRSGGSSKGVPAAAKDMEFVPTSSPERSKHRNYLLFPAHDLGQEDVVILGLDVEGLLDYIVAAGVQDVGAFLKHVGYHKDDNIVTVLFPQGVHGLRKLLPPVHETGGVYAGYLTDPNVLFCNMELLVIGHEQLLGTAVLSGGGGEKLLALHAKRRDTDRPGIYGYIVDLSGGNWNIEEEKRVILKL